jgi:hypothetical protein
MAVNKAIIIGTIGITTAGIIAAVVKKKAVTPVIIAGYLVALSASVLDLAGGDVSVLAGGIVMAAFFGVILTEVPWVNIFAAGNAIAAGGVNAGTAAKGALQPGQAAPNVGQGPR